MHGTDLYQPWEASYAWAKLALLDGEQPCGGEVGNDVGNDVGRKWVPHLKYEALLQSIIYF